MAFKGLCIFQLKWPIFTFTFTHLADAFIQSDLQFYSSSYSFTFYQLLLSLGIEPMILALLAPCSTIWATGKLLYLYLFYDDSLICDKF